MNDAEMTRRSRNAAKQAFGNSSTVQATYVSQYPVSMEREYIRVTNTYMTLLNLTLKDHLPTICKIISAERGIRHDGAEEARNLISHVFLKINEAFEKRAARFGLGRKIQDLADRCQKLSIWQWKRTVKRTLGMNISENHYLGEFFRGNLNQWTQRNVDLIKTIPKNTLTDMKRIVEDGFTAGKTNTAIGKEIQAKYALERHHAQFIARDQMAKLNCEMTREQHRDAGVEAYVWSSSGDEKVRKRHAYLDGKTFKWSEPPIVDLRTGRRAAPGQDFQCRCVALPKFNLSELSLPWEDKP